MLEYSRIFATHLSTKTMFCVSRLASSGSPPSQLSKTPNRSGAPTAGGNSRAKMKPEIASSWKSGNCWHEHCRYHASARTSFGSDMTASVMAAKNSSVTFRMCSCRFSVSTCGTAAVFPPAAAAPAAVPALCPSALAPFPAAEAAEGAAFDVTPLVVVVVAVAVVAEEAC